MTIADNYYFLRSIISMSHGICIVKVLEETHRLLKTLYIQCMLDKYRKECGAPSNYRRWKPPELPNGPCDEVPSLLVKQDNRQSWPESKALSLDSMAPVSALLEQVVHEKVLIEDVNLITSAVAELTTVLKLQKTSTIAEFIVLCSKQKWYNEVA